MVGCPECGNQRIWKNGIRYIRGGRVQRFLCRFCGHRFSDCKVEVDVLEKRFVFSDSVHDFGDLDAVDGAFCDVGFHDSAFTVREDVGSHSFPSVGKTIKEFPRNSGERRVCASDGEAKNLVKVETRTENWAAGATQLSRDAKSKILEFALWLKKNGYAKSTIVSRSKLLKIMVRRGANLYDPESIKEVVAKQKWSEGRKSNAVDAYSSFLQMVGGKWHPPRYARPRRIPFIPLESEIDQLIAGFNIRMAAFCQLVKETGARPGEAHKLKWIDIDPNSNTVRINEPEKKGNPRLLKVSPKLVAMLNTLPKKTEYVFATVKLRTLQRSFQRQRKRVAFKLQNPRLRKINFIVLRHFKGTMEYYKTKDILHVMMVLGHKNIKNTLIYTHLVKFAEKDEFFSKVAHSVEEACELIDKGFEYVGCVNGAEIFRKRK